MKYYTVVARLNGALAGAVAVEWTDQAAPLDSGRGWEPCLRRPDGGWRFASHDPAGAVQPHRRSPGAFGDLAIRYRTTAAGPWSAAAAARKEIVIVAIEGEGPTGPGGGADGGAVVPPTVRPASVVAPALLGGAEIGGEIAVDPGLWSGVPAPDLVFRWRRDGIDIPGATAAAYAPTPADDGAALDCMVTASNAAGAAAAAAGPLRAAYPAPRVLGAPPEAVFDEAAGAGRVEAAPAFAGANLAFAVAEAPAGVAIDRASGALSLPLDRPVAGARVRVTATNSGGTAAVELVFTVRAVPPAAPRAAEVRVLRSVWRPAGQRETFSPALAFPGLPGAAASDLQWTAALNFEGEDWEQNWHPVAAEAASEFQLYARGHPVPAGTFDPAVWTLANAARLTRLRFRRRVAADRPWSAASEAFTVPAPVAAVPPVLVAPLPLVESQVGRTVTLDAAAHFAGDGPIAYAKAAGPAWITVDAATGVVTFVAPATAGTAAYAISASNPAGAIQATGAFSGTAAPAAPDGLLPLPPAAVLNAVLSESSIRYNFAEFDGSGGGNRFKSSHTNILCLIAAKSGHAGARAYVLNWLRFLCAGAHTPAGNRLPSGRGGVNMQHHMVLAMTVAVAATIPAIWNDLTAGERSTLDLTMKGLLATACWQNSDNNVYVQAGGGSIERRIDGGQYGRGRVLNFTHPSVIVPVIVSAYMGGPTLGAGATQFLETFGRASFAAQLQAAGIHDMWFVYSAVRSTDGRAGPSFAEFEAALRGYAYRGLRLTRAADVKALVLDEINRHWTRTFKPGITLGAGAAIPLGCERRASETHGIFENVSAAGAPLSGQGRGAMVARMTDMSKWALHRYPGQIGMAPGLDVTDAGDGRGGNQPRSSMVYAHDECRGILMSIATLVSLGMLSRTDGDLKTAFERQGRGVWDLQFRNQHGYRSFAKGGALWDSGQTSGDWTSSGATAQSYNLPALYSLWLDVVEPWYGV